MKSLCMLFALSFWVGCAGDDDSGGGSPIALDDFGQQLGTVSCQKLFDCCTDAELMANFMGITIEGQPITTVEQCTSLVAGLFTSFAVEDYKASIELGRAEYSADAAGSCVGQLSGLSCSQYSSLSSGGAGSDVDCEPYIIAKVGDGGACSEDYECTSDNCEGASQDVDGACKVKPTLGQDCDQACASGSYCTYDQSAGKRICVALKPDSTACQLDSECSSDNCDEATDTCVTPAPKCDGR